MSVSEFQSYLLKYKKHLAIFVSLSLLLCAFYINISKSYTAEIFIKYLGEGAEAGLTENSMELNPYEIADALIVKKTLESIGEKGGEYNSVRKNITVTPVVLSSEEAKYASYLDNFSDYGNTEENKTHPVYYSIKFTSGKSEEYARRFLNSLVAQYRIYYVEKYAYNSDMTLISEKAVMQYDYFETAEILENKLRNNISYLNNIVESDIDFRSSQTGYSMTDLATEYESILQNDLADVSQLILEKGISKNGAVLKKTLQNRAENAEMESNMNAEKANSNKELLMTYSKKNKEYVWNKSNIEDEHQIHSDAERDYIYDTDKSVYDQMALSYNDFSIRSKDLLIDKAVYMRNSERFSEKSVQDPQVEKALSAICGKYNTIQQLTEATISDYNNFKSARCLANVSGIAVSENVSDIIYYVSTLVLSIGLGIIVIVFLELKRKKKI